MSIQWSKEEIEEFDNLVDATGIHDQVERINGRLDMGEFIAKHGKEKCDAMWAHLNCGGKVEASGESQ